MWHTGILPDSWKEALVIPIPKPGKDSTNPANYRPIALTSCICKTKERMVYDCLVWFLEKKKLIATVQSGFPKQRGTLDHLMNVNLESELEIPIPTLISKKWVFPSEAFFQLHYSVSKLTIL